MKLNLSKSEEQKIRDLLVGTKIRYGHKYSYQSGRTADRVGVIESFYFDKEKKQWRIKTDFSELRFRDWLVYLKNGAVYRTQSKKIQELADMYIKCNKQNLEEEFHNFLENLDEGKFNIKDVNIYDDEIEWLNEHVTNITARFPQKYAKNFLKNFPGAEYTIGENSWNYSFTMYFDDLSNVPDSLLELKNRDGNSLDFDKKLMRNTSYIWKLVKTYPQFSFGKRELQK